MDMIESHILFNKLVEKSKKYGLILEFKDNNFIFRTGYFGRYKTDNGQHRTECEQTMRVSECSYETLSYCIDMWKFCCEFHETKEKCDSMELVR